MDAEQRWPRGLLRDLDSLSVDRHDQPSSTRRSYSRPRVYRPQENSRHRAQQASRQDGNRKASNNTSTTARRPEECEVFPAKKSLILCFDGTGNKFQGSAGDSNILKIYSMLDKEDPHVFRYYQPGIGTYVESSSLSRKSRVGRIKSWYKKAKDQAVGTSFGEHVMAGYKFLMRYYSAGDDIYFFGRGAYTARFLAQMLDYIGLLSTGNEEMLRFAWKTFSRWQMLTEGTNEEKKKKHEQFKYMEQFRETFSRPISNIRFVGLFDCVNSVPQFESVWMKRKSRFPYTAKMSADVIRHAVAIDERRAKFRQDLVSQTPPKQAKHRHFDDYMQWLHLDALKNKVEGENEKQKPQRPEAQRNDSSQARFRPQKTQHHRHARPGSPDGMRNSVDYPISPRQTDGYDQGQNHKQEGGQDISEVWFAGEHADIGGGWWLLDDEIRPASDLPLIWMLREAQRAGMPLDEAKMARAQYHAGEMGIAMDETYRLDGKVDDSDGTFSMSDIEYLATQTRLHDSLTFSGGLPWTAVMAWLVMEHLPFRRMDLQPDGTWKPISWPLPRGETRDMPDDAQVHSSVIQRMKADSNYRPGNLIIGGGGRGVRKAPKSAGIGKWRVIRERGDPIGESVVRVVRRSTGLGF